MIKPALLVDARNALYRAVYAGMHDKRDHVKYHHFVLFLRQIVSWIRRYDPTSVHIFWDVPRATVWRKKVLATYKDRSKSTYVEDISAELTAVTKISQEFFEVMNVRQYYKKEMEADDLIYAAVAMIHQDPTIIVSTDSDMTQIPFSFSSCTVFDPQKKKEVPTPIISPVMQKALVGDKSDSIDGYYGIGPKKSGLLLADPFEFAEFLELKGKSKFYRNLLLIDLSANPRALANKTYVHRQLCKRVHYSKNKINELILFHKVQGLMQEFANLIPPFKKLV